VRGKGGKKENRDFFTSGSREAEPACSQRMAKDEQLTGSGEGAGEKGTKKAKKGAEGARRAPRIRLRRRWENLRCRPPWRPGREFRTRGLVPRALQDPRVIGNAKPNPEVFHCKNPRERLERNRPQTSPTPKPFGAIPGARHWALSITTARK